MGARQNRDRAATGGDVVARSSPKNTAERELDRLGITRPQVLPSQGDPRADRLVAKHMGPLVEKIVSNAISNEAYQRLPDGMKTEILRRLLAEIRQNAKVAAAREDPGLFGRLAIERRPLWQRQLLEGGTQQ